MNQLFKLAFLPIFKHWFVCLVFFGVFLVAPPVQGETIHKEKDVMHSKSLEQRGTQLRAAIEHEYERLDNAKELMPRKTADISNIVINYIPVGISFDDAEQILRSAGFKVGQRIGPNTPISDPIRVPNQRYELVAKIDFFRATLASKASVLVFLSPENPENYDKVSAVKAVITLSFL